MKITKIEEIFRSIKFEDDDLKKMVERIISKIKLPPYMLGFNFEKKGKTKTKKHGYKRCNQSENRNGKQHQ